MEAKDDSMLDALTDVFPADEVVEYAKFTGVKFAKILEALFWGRD